MSPGTHALPPKQRKEIILEYVSQESYEHIARRCGCAKRTIVRDVNFMKVTGEWFQFLEKALLRYLKSDTVSDTAKFTKIADLYAKQFMVSKHDTTVREEPPPLRFEWVTPKPRDRVRTTHRPDLIP